MNNFKKIVMMLLLSPMAVFGAVTTDNEIALQQVGDTLTLTIDQIGYGNKLGGTISSGVVGSDWILTGTSLNVNIDMIGNSNQIFGPTILDSSTLSVTMTGSSNIWDWTVGASGSADSSNLLAAITGSSNTFDIDWGAAASAERLDMDLDIIGSSNVFTIDWESDDIDWNVDITGDSNDVLTHISDGAYHEFKLDHTGDSGNIDIIMSSGTCSGISSCKSTIDIDSTSDNATITINQKDTGD